MALHFGRNTLDLETMELCRDGSRVDIEPRSFAVLAYLVENRHRVVRKDELLDVVWGDRFVSESALTTRIKHCRRAVGDDGEAQKVIKTVHRVGYRFVAEVSDPDAVAGHLVSAATSGDHELFGRVDDLRAVADRLADHRVVTVTGPAGVGKSRLCVAVAEKTGPESIGESWLCDLTSVRETGALGGAVLDAVGERQHSDADPTESLRRVLESRHGVLVLDNCEHLLDAVRDLVNTLTDSCAHVRVLATSRLTLGTDLESIVVLQPLAPEAAVACFVARALDGGVRLDEADPDIAALCKRLDRVPLALELAAARARLLSPQQMIDLLDDRFRLLRRPHSGNGNDLDGSLAEAIAWSWEHLDDADQELLGQLSVFVGAFALEDATGVATSTSDPLDVVDSLDRLTRASMLVTTPGTSGSRRFHLLESIRDYVNEQLGDPHEARTRHAWYFTQLIERLDAEMQTESVDESLAVMTAAWPNVRAAVHHAARDGDIQTVRRIVRGVGAYADLYQAYEVIDWCELAALTTDHHAPDIGGETALVADATAIWARLLAHRGEHERGSALASQAHSLNASFATVLSLVWTAYYQGDLDQVVSGARRLVELSRTDRGLDHAYADGFTAIVAAVQQDPVLHHTEVTADEAESGLMGALRCLTAGFRLCAADPDRASELLDAVVTSALRNDYRLLLGAAASTLTQITVPSLPPNEGMTILCRTLSRYRERSMWTLISADTVMAAKLLADTGELDVATRLLGARGASGYRSGLSEVMRSLLHDQLAAQLGGRFAELIAEGAQWPPPRAGDVAIAAMRLHLGRHE
jgi:predicted ATPase/DNA-binding winged helix-turn-helix (wHTH) protein